MASNNTLAQRQPQSGADPGWFCRKEWLKDAGLEFRRDAWPGVQHCKPHLLLRHVVLRREDDLVWRRGLTQSIVRIGKKIHHDLVQLIRVAPERRQVVCQLLDDVNLIELQRIPQQLQGLLDHVVELHTRVLWRVRTRQGEKIPHDALTAYGCLMN